MTARGLVFALVLSQFAARGEAPIAFSVSEIAIHQPGVHVFMAQLAAAEVPVLGVLDGSFLSFYPETGLDPRITLNLRPGTSAIDIADLDADGHAEVVAIEHGRVVRYDVRRTGTAVEPQVLFETPPTMPGRAPFPAVLVVPWEGLPAVALPLAEVLQIRGISGNIAAEFRADPASPSPFRFGAPFSVHGIVPAQAGAARGSIEWVINKTTDDVPMVPESLEAPPLSAPVLGRIGSPGMTRAAGSHAPETWPWFALRTVPVPNERVHFALSPPDYRDTLITIRRHGSERRGIPADPSRPAPARLYPGILVPPREALPDFDGDGYTDLVLWNTPTPGTSIEGITRAMHEGSWPVMISVHLFDPAQGLFEARPNAIVRTGVPLFWFADPEDGVPVRNLTLADFDGDRHFDLGFSTSPTSFSIWLYKVGFPVKPSFHRTFRQSIGECEILPSPSRPVIVLRSATAIHILSGSDER